MIEFTVTCVEQLPSGNWRVMGPHGGRPFVLKERSTTWNTPLVIWLREPHPGRVCKILVPDWRALRHRQLVGDEAYEANQARKRDLRERRKTGADVQLWDRRFRTARGSRSTLEQTLAKFGGTKALTRADVEAHGGRVMILPVPEQFDPTGKGIPMAFWGGRFRGRVHDEVVIERSDGSILPSSSAPEQDPSRTGGRKAEAPNKDTNAASGRHGATSGS